MTTNFGILVKEIYNRNEKYAIYEFFNLYTIEMNAGKGSNLRSSWNKVFKFKYCQ